MGLEQALKYKFWVFKVLSAEQELFLLANLTNLSFTKAHIKAIKKELYRIINKYNKLISDFEKELEKKELKNGV